MAFEFWFGYNPIPDTQNTEWLRLASAIEDLEEVAMKVTIKVETTGVSDELRSLVDSSTIGDAATVIGVACAAIGTVTAEIASSTASIDFGAVVASISEAERALDDLSATVAQAVIDTNNSFLPPLSFTEQDMPPPQPNPLGFVYVGNDTWLPEKLHAKRRQVQYQAASRPHRPLWPGLKPRHLRQSSRRRR